MVTYETVTTATGLSFLRQAHSASTRILNSPSVNAGANFSPRSTFAMNSIFSRVRRGSSRISGNWCFPMSCSKSPPSEMNATSNTRGFRLAPDRLRNLKHPAGFRQIEGTWSKEYDPLRFRRSFLGQHRSHERPHFCLADEELVKERRNETAREFITMKEVRQIAKDCNVGRSDANLRRLLAIIGARSAGQQLHLKRILRFGERDSRSAFTLPHIGREELENIQVHFCHCIQLASKGTLRPSRCGMIRAV